MSLRYAAVMGPRLMMAPLLALPRPCADIDQFRVPPSYMAKILRRAWDSPWPPAPIAGRYYSACVLWLAKTAFDCRAPALVCLLPRRRLHGCSLRLADGGRGRQPGCSSRATQKALPPVCTTPSTRPHP